MLREASAYFAGEGRLHSALHRLTQRLDAEEIPYALLGGLALAEHGYPRLTEDIELLLTPSGLERFRQRLVGRGYRPAFSGAEKTFRDAETAVRIEIVTAGEYPGDGLPKPVAFPDPTTPGMTIEIEGIRVVTLEKLIELKLASGMSASPTARPGRCARPDRPPETPLGTGKPIGPIRTGGLSGLVGKSTRRQADRLARTIRREHLDFSNRMPRRSKCLSDTTDAFCAST
jgi:hypothetical protein